VKAVLFAILGMLSSAKVEAAQPIQRAECVAQYVYFSEEAKKADLEIGVGSARPPGIVYYPGPAFNVVVGESAKLLSGSADDKNVGLTLGVSWADYPEQTIDASIHIPVPGVANGIALHASAIGSKEGDVVTVSAEGMRLPMLVPVTVKHKAHPKRPIVTVDYLDSVTMTCTLR
jgi:hypothetical protein